MQITVILCTYNRSRSLARVLKTVVAQTLPPEVEWEILVVDSSSDDTREVVEGFSRDHPGRIRYVFEGKPGKSNALNTGIQEARGEILAFVDDDVTVEANWLSRLTSAFDDPHCAGAGGRVVLEWTCARPRWLLAKAQRISIPTAGHEVPLDGTLAGFDQGDTAGELRTAPIGTNMAFRKAMFASYGHFRTDMGPSRAVSTATSEDIEFGRRLLAAGERLRYEPEAIVYHPVWEARVKKAYFLDWWFAYGRAIALEFGPPKAHRYWWGVPRYLFRRLAGKTMRWILAVHPTERFINKIRVWQVAGEIVEMHRQSTHGPARESRSR
jgi:glucosyl-dolichyl phosphate glucuronosyltransferase